ncbi:MAG: hypothetical protein ACT4OM_01770 [Actinomycetota bacterium]
MDIWSVLKVVLRHWVVTLISLCVSAFLVLQVGSRIDPGYLARKSVILLFPARVEQGETNPFNRGSERFAASVVVLKMNTPEFAERARDVGVSGEFLTSIAATEGTIVDFTATSRSSPVAIESTALLAELFEAELEELQEDSGAPPSTWIQVKPLTSSQEAVPQFGSRTRVLVAGAILGMASATGAAFLAEANAGRRAKRQRAESPAPVNGRRRTGSSEPGAPQIDSASDGIEATDETI